MSKPNYVSWESSAYKAECSIMENGFYIGECVLYFSVIEKRIDCSFQVAYKSSSSSNRFFCHDKVHDSYESALKLLTKVVEKKEIDTYHWVHKISVTTQKKIPKPRLKAKASDGTLMQGGFAVGILYFYVSSVFASHSDIPLEKMTELTKLAFARHSQEFAGLNLDEIGDILSQLPVKSILGHLRPVKGILHELVYCYLENVDGDDVFASPMENTNHPTNDIIKTDYASGEISYEQLKATSNLGYAKQAINNPDTNVVVTEEIAKELGIPSSGISEAALERFLADQVGYGSKVENVSGEVATSDSFWDLILEHGLILGTLMGVALLGTFIYFMIRQLLGLEDPKQK